MAVAVVQVTGSGTTPMPNGSSTTNNGLVITPTLPSAPSSTNLCVILIQNDAGGLTSVSVPTPSGWTAGPTVANTAGDNILASFYRTGFTSTSQAVTLNATTGGSTYYGSGIMLELSGANNSSPTNASGALANIAISTTPQTITGASATPSVSGCLALGLWGWNDLNSDTAGNTVQSGWTASFNFTNFPTNSNYSTVYAASLASPTSGTALTSTLNVTQASYISPNYANLLWIIAPAGAGGYFSQSNFDANMANMDGGLNGGYSL